MVTAGVLSAEAATMAQLEPRTKLGTAIAVVISNVCTGSLCNKIIPLD